MNGTGIGESFEYLDVTMWRKGFANRTFEFDDSHISGVEGASGTVHSLITRMIDAGWGILSVHLHTNYNDSRTDGKGDYVDISSADVLAAFFDALSTETEHAGTAYVYGELYGWNNESFFEHQTGGRRFLEYFQGVYSSSSYLRDLAMEVLDNSEDVFIPTWVDVDYNSTGENLMQDYDSEEYGGEIYLFPKH